MNWTLLQSDPNWIDPLYRALEALVAKYWWVVALIVLAWYLRWYGYEVANNAEGRTAAIFSAAGATAKHMAYSLNKAARSIGLLVIALILWAAWIFGIIPSILPALGTFDPVAWATVIGATVAGAAGIDAAWATPSNAILAFAGTLVALVVLPRVGSLILNALGFDTTQLDFDTSSSNGGSSSGSGGTPDSDYYESPDDDSLFGGRF